MSLVNPPGPHSRKVLVQKKGLNFIRSNSGSFKGARLKNKVRKTASLPATPLSEEFKFAVEDKDGNINGAPLSAPPGEPQASTVAGRVTDANSNTTQTSISSRPGISMSNSLDPDETLHYAASHLDPNCLQRVIDVGQWSSKGVSFLMDTPAVLSKSRTEKFHKLFKSVPQNEYPIDYFACAYIGDILLQGNFYVSQNWFCFYSRIRGRGRLLEIPMDSVISITREKTALIFPNAIGLQTKKEKFAFGSFISRDNTYKFIVSVWKKSQEVKAAAYERVADNDRDSGTLTRDSVQDASENESQDKDPVDPDNPDTGENLENNNISNISHSNSKTESTDQSDISVCLECGSVDPSDTNDYRAKDQSDPSGSQPTCSSTCDKTPSNTHSHLSRERRVTHKQKKHIEPGGLQFPYSVLPCIDRRKTIAALRTSAVKLQSIPRTNLLLAICTVLVLFLIISSVVLTYKILDLEAKMESQGLWSSSKRDQFRGQTLGSMFYLQSTVKESSAQHMQTILKANMKILEEINSNMKNLYKDTCTE